jgi:hypothetical protein
LDGRSVKQIAYPAFYSWILLLTAPPFVDLTALAIVV